MISIRRKGAWTNLQFTHFLGVGARLSARQRTRQAIDRLNGLIENMLGNSSLSPAHPFLSELQKNLSEWDEKFLARAHRIGEEVFREDLHKEDLLWLESEGAYGVQRPYRPYVATKVADWFTHGERTHLHGIIDAKTGEAWQSEVLDRVEVLCAVAPGAKPGTSAEVAGSSKQA